MRATLTMFIAFAPKHRDNQNVMRRRGDSSKEPALPYALAYALALGGAATLAFADFSAANETLQ